MEILKWIIVFLVIIFSVLLFYFSLKSKKFFSTVLVNALSGIFAIIIINLTEKYIGCHIPINPYTVSFSALFGIPAVVVLLIINLLFI